MARGIATPPWIPMRLNLARDPEVVQIARRLDVDVDLVVGKLHRLWSWANEQTTDGLLRIAFVTDEERTKNGQRTDKERRGDDLETWLDGEMKLPGVTRAIADIKWIIVQPDGIQIVEYDRWNSQSAKRRLVRARQGQVAGGEKAKERPKNDQRTTSESPDFVGQEKEEEKEEEIHPPNPPSGGTVGESGRLVAEQQDALRDVGLPGRQAILDEFPTVSGAMIREALEDATSRDNQGVRYDRLRKRLPTLIRQRDEGKQNKQEQATRLSGMVGRLRGLPPDRLSAIVTATRRGSGSGLEPYWDADPMEHDDLIRAVAKFAIANPVAMEAKSDDREKPNKWYERKREREASGSVGEPGEGGRGASEPDQAGPGDGGADQGPEGPQDGPARQAERGEHGDERPDPPAS